MKDKAAFIDRDGTLIEERGYICDFSQAAVFPFAVEAVQLLNEHHYKVIMITNQSSIARGICTVEQVEELHKRLKSYFLERGAVIDAVYYCPYHEEGIIEQYKKKHEWRKPAPGMILHAAREHGLDLQSSFVIGDNECDILAGQNAGCQSILVLTGKGEQVKKELSAKAGQPFFIAPHLLDAAGNMIDHKYTRAEPAALP